MSRKNKSYPILEKVEITAFAAEGKALSRINNKVLFVKGAIPGDVVDVKVTRSKTSFMEGEMIKLHTASPQRVEPFCKHFGICGGCKWQQLDYPFQAKYKEQTVKDQLERIGGLDVSMAAPIISAPKNKYYRNKLEFTFSSKKWLTIEQIQSENEFIERRGLGFHLPGMFDKILDIEECFLQDDLSNKLRNFIRDYTMEHNYSYYAPKEKNGFMRNLIIRNTSLGEWMLIVVFHEDNKELISNLMQAIENNFPQLSSLQYVINPKLNDTIHDQEVICWSGNNYITEDLDGLKFRINPKSFFQTNTEQALALYRKVKEFAALSGTETVYDLYCGTGTIGLFVADKASKIIGLEFVEEAVIDAKHNAILNGIEHASFFAGDIKNLLSEEFFKINGKPDLIITDPPRAGMHEDVVQAINQSGAKKVVYVSCNSATQARDLKLMEDFYTVTKLQAVDMFPHTHHVENIALLIKK
jgi:23S rRNA (uracil1939-C5)-methyltransferase